MIAAIIDAFNLPQVEDRLHNQHFLVLDRLGDE
jgi:hypothetical protein